MLLSCRVLRECDLSWRCNLSSVHSDFALLLGGGFVLEFLFCFVFVLFLGGFAVSSVGVHVPITTVRPCIENAE